jgi:hypothetical protein
MKTLAAALALCAAAFAQTLTPSPVAVAPAGSKLSFDLVLSGSAADGAGISGIDFTLSGLPYTATTAAAGKIIRCNGAVCLVAGGDPANLNSTVMGNGVVATITVTVPAAPVTLTMPTLHAVNPAGAEIAITGASVTISPTAVASPCDLNGDGVTDASDLATFLSGFVAGNCTADLNGNGVCDVIDWQRLISAAKGQGCRTGK